MTPEERLLSVILDEIKAIKDSQAKFQDEMRHELAQIRKELHERDLVLDRLRGKISTIAAVAAIIAAGVMQWLGNIFFR